MLFPDAWSVNLAIASINAYVSTCSNVVRRCSSFSVVSCQMVCSSHVGYITLCVRVCTCVCVCVGVCMLACFVCLSVCDCRLCWRGLLDEFLASTETVARLHHTA